MELLFQRDRDRQTLLALLELNANEWTTALPRSVGDRLRYLGLARTCHAGHRQGARLTERGARMAATVSSLFNDGKDTTL